MRSVSFREGIIKWTVGLVGVFFLYRFIPLMEEILHQLIWRIYHYLQGFLYIQTVVGNGISEASRVLAVVISPCSFRSVLLGESTWYWLKVVSQLKAIAVHRPWFLSPKSMVTIGYQKAHGIRGWDFFHIWKEHSVDSIAWIIYIYNFTNRWHTGKAAFRPS